jgi:undecaprenyl-diphosphatase
VSTDSSSSPGSCPGAGTQPPAPTGRQLDTLELSEAGVIGVAQSALFAGISRSGVTMVGGLLRGLDHEDAARFAFLLATPILLGVGVYNNPDLLGPLGDGVSGQALASAAAGFVAAYVAVRFPERWFERRTSCRSPRGASCSASPR